AAEVAKLIEGFSGEDKERAAEVAELIAGFKKEREEASIAWKELLTKMSAKEKKIVSIPEALEPKEKEVSIPEATEIEEKEVSIEEKVLEFIEKHPEGVRIGDMEGPLGVMRMRLGRIAKKLLDEGKLRKEENLYFLL
ncbi:hypothetical protein KJ974_01060, partial [bacterium]|nr:hypothetical protein [bacterium]